MNKIKPQSKSSLGASEMIRPILLLVLFAITASALPPISFFKVCAHDYYNRDRPNECRLKNYDFDPSIPRIQDYMNCVFLGYKWMPDDRSYKVQTQKIVSDLKAKGSQNESDAQKVLAECENKSGRKIGALDYFRCLLENPKTKAGILKKLKVHDEEFFKRC